MARQKLPTDYRERPLEKWTAHQFRQYLADQHFERYGIAYVSRSIAMEAKMIRMMIDATGVEMTKEFIDECFRDYRPTERYPSLNFVFMYSYMRERILPRLLAEHKRREQMKMATQEAIARNEMSLEELSDWL